MPPGHCPLRRRPSAGMMDRARCGVGLAVRAIPFTPLQSLHLPTRSQMALVARSHGRQRLSSFSVDLGNRQCREGREGARPEPSPQIFSPQPCRRNRHCSGRGAGAGSRAGLGTGFEVKRVIESSPNFRGRQWRIFRQSGIAVRPTVEAKHGGLQPRHFPLGPGRPSHESSL